MSNAMKIGLVMVGGFLLVLLGFGCSAISTNNTCVRSETGLEAQYAQNQNNYANYFNKLKETAQVPKMYAGDLEKVYKGAISGRYGTDGSKAVVSFIQEHNPNLDSKLYQQIQRVIEAGRDSFQADQKTLLDKRRVYQNTLGEFPGSMVAGMLGFPKVDLKKYDPVVNEETEDAFRTKKAGPISIQ